MESLVQSQIYKETFSVNACTTLSFYTKLQKSPAQLLGIIGLDDFFLNATHI